MKKDHLILIFWGVLIFVGGFYTGTKFTFKQTHETQEDNYRPYLAYELFGDCNREQCLLKEVGGTDIGGYGKIRGYYYSYTKDFYGEEGAYGGRHTCDAIIVTTESAPIVKNLIDWAKTAKTDEFTPGGDFILTSQIPSEFRDTIIKSNIENQIELGLINKIQPGHGAIPCQGLVDIISVKQI